MNAETLTIENLARSIHEHHQQAVIKVRGRRIQPDNPGWWAWEELHELDKEIRREEARLMLNRWMR